MPVLYGAVVEGVATCLCRLASRSLSDLNPRYATAIDSFIGTSLVVAGEFFLINLCVAFIVLIDCHGFAYFENNYNNNQ